MKKYTIPQLFVYIVGILMVGWFVFMLTLVAQMIIKHYFHWTFANLL